MTFRPIAARWFELVTVHKDLARSMECLSRTGAVQLEALSSRAERLVLPDVADQLKAFHELARRYQSYWPPAAPTGKRRAEHLSETLSTARKRLETWAEKADPIIASIEQIAREITDIDNLNEALAHAGAGFPDLKLLVAAGPRLQARLVRLAAGSRLREVPALVLLKSWTAPSANYMLVVGRQRDIGEIEGQLAALKARVVALPSWLPSAAEAALAPIAKRGAQLAEQMQARKDELAALSEELQIASALGDIALLEWLNEHAKDLRGSERLAWVTGWTSDVQGTRLRRALDAEGVRHILKLTDAPAGTNAPMVLSNPGWVRGFEIFARMLGTPAHDESDPSVVLAVIVPLIFGFMFGDVGQGFVILLAGLALGQRFPLLKMLVPGGIVAMGFGLLFGSVFCREDLIPALWLHPLANPVMILIAAVALGVAVLSIGLALDAVQAHWRGAAHLWWSSRAGLAVFYFGVLVAPFWLGGLSAAALGLTWYIFGSFAVAEERRFGTLARAAGEFVEESLRLLVNTVSFTRVGAFALAHAGLSAAIVEVATTTGPIGYWIVLALGNVMVIALEGLVVGIQTTRLMLFEFFVRFLAARGREFKALPPPQIAKTPLSQASLGGTS
jgi:V/A-type H+/Na+-transporting ATPase subunit I